MKEKWQERKKERKKITHLKEGWILWLLETREKFHNFLKVLSTYIWKKIICCLFVTLRSHKPRCLPLCSWQVWWKPSMCTSALREFSNVYTYDARVSEYWIILSFESSIKSIKIKIRKIKVMLLVLAGKCSMSSIIE